MFRRTKADETEPAHEAPDSTGKGRPTPSRKEAEAARKQALKVPKDPRAARKAARERDRRARLDSRSRMLAGDERAFPPRDQGPVRRYVRDFVDSRLSLAEFFIFIALAILLFGFIPSTSIQQWVNLTWFALLALVVLDVASTLLRLRSSLRRHVDDPALRKGCMWYAAIRLLQLRRLRLPKPAVRRGEIPAPPSLK